MDDEGRPVRMAAAADISEINAGWYGADDFQFRLEEMDDYEGYHLN